MIYLIPAVRRGSHFQGKHGGSYFLNEGFEATTNSTPHLFWRRALLVLKATAMCIIIFSLFLLVL